MIWTTLRVAAIGGVVGLGNLLFGGATLVATIRPEVRLIAAFLWIGINAFAYLEARKENGQEVKIILKAAGAIALGLACCGLIVMLVNADAEMGGVQSGVLLTMAAGLTIAMVALAKTTIDEHRALVS